MLTSTPSRSHRSAGRTAAVALAGLVVVAALVGAGYAAARRGLTVHRASATATGRGPAGAVSRAPADSATSAPAVALPAPTTGSSIIAFVALPVGAPSSAGVGDDHYGWHRLVATLHVPPRASAGSTADLTVRLRNPTASAISLDPCPAYDVSVGNHTTSYGLNCSASATGVIAPGGSLTFAVQTSIPFDTTVGSRVEVSWSLGWQPDRTSPHAHQRVTVTG